MGIYDYTKEETGRYTGSKSNQSAYLGNQLVRPVGYQPGTNTILYMPLKTDLKDHGPNNIDMTLNGTITIDSRGANFSKTGNLTGVSPNVISGDFTFSSWVNLTDSGGGPNVIEIGAPYPGRGYRYGANGGGYAISIRYGFTLYSVIDVPSSITFSTLYGNWHNFVMTRIGTLNTLYLDGTNVLTYTGTSMPSSNSIKIGGSNLNNSNNWIVGHVNYVLIESVGRTSEEVSAYYNQTKSNYGL